MPESSWALFYPPLAPHHHQHPPRQSTGKASRLGGRNQELERSLESRPHGAGTLQPCACAVYLGSASYYQSHQSWASQSHQSPPTSTGCSRVRGHSSVSGGATAASYQQPQSCAAARMQLARCRRAPTSSSSSRRSVSVMNLMYWLVSVVSSLYCVLRSTYCSRGWQSAGTECPQHTMARHSAP